MAISPVAKTKFHIASGGTVTSSPIDTSAANLIVVGIGRNAAVTLDDSKHLTWNALNEYNDASLIYSRLYYAYGAGIGDAAHTFTVTGSLANACVLSYSGAANPTFDQQGGADGNASGAATTAHSSTVMPSEDNELIVTFACLYTTPGTCTVDQGFTVQNQDDDVLSAVIADLIQTTAAAKDPTITRGSGSGYMSITTATFKAAADGGGGPVIPVFMNQYRQRRN